MHENGVGVGLEAMGEPSLVKYWFYEGSEYPWGLKREKLPYWGTEGIGGFE